MKWGLHKKTKMIDLEKKFTQSISEIFPLDNTYTAAVISASQLPTEKNFSVISKKSFNNHKVAANEQSKIIESGIYLQNLATKASVPSEHQWQTKLNNVCSHSSIYIREKLNPALVSAIDEQSFVAVSSDQCAVYYYLLKNKIKNNLSGFCSYVTDVRENKILGIATSIINKTTYVALTLSCGMILIAELNGSQFDRIFGISLDVYKDKNPYVFLNKDGYLSVYFKQDQQLKVWNIADQLTLVGQCAYQLTQLKLSTSGKLLTAIDAANPSSVYVFNLKLNKQHKLNFAEPLTDFAIGYQDRFCLASGNKFRYYDDANVRDNLKLSGSSSCFFSRCKLTNFFKHKKEKNSEHTTYHFLSHKSA